MLRYRSTRFAVRHGVVMKINRIEQGERLDDNMAPPLLNSNLISALQRPEAGIYAADLYLQRPQVNRS